MIFFVEVKNPAKDILVYGVLGRSPDNHVPVANAYPTIYEIIVDFHSVQDETGRHFVMACRSLLRIVSRSVAPA
jgi:hypothetical protein